MALADMCLCLRGRKKTFAPDASSSVCKRSGHEEGAQIQEQWVSCAEGKTGTGGLEAKAFKYTIHLSEVCTLGEFILSFTKVQRRGTKVRDFLYQRGVYELLSKKREKYFY